MLGKNGASGTFVKYVGSGKKERNRANKANGNDKKEVVFHKKSMRRFGEIMHANKEGVKHGKHYFNGG